MAKNLIINHHFFYEESDPLCRAFRGPSPLQFERQLRSLSDFVEKRPGKTLGISITIDDGSKSILNVVDLLEDCGLDVAICFCGNSSQHRAVLLPHKLNLIRSTLGDALLLDNLKTWLAPLTIGQFPLDPLVREADLYRYDMDETRQLKIALNYRLSSELMNEFLCSAFDREFGSESEFAAQLYLSHYDLLKLRNNFSLVWHGKFHHRWATLPSDRLAEELTPSEESLQLLGDSYEVAIPFGMKGSWKEGELEKFYPQITGAYTMLRSTEQSQSANGFNWKHRFDQADLFDKNGEALEANLIKFLGFDELQSSPC